MKETVNARSTSEARKLVPCERIHLNRGGYTSRGSYYGTGAPLYELDCLCRKTHVRAANAHLARLAVLYGEKCGHDRCAHGAWKDSVSHGETHIRITHDAAHVAWATVCRRSGKDRNGRPIARECDPVVAWVAPNWERYEDCLEQAREFSSQEAAMSHLKAAYDLFFAGAL